MSSSDSGAPVSGGGVAGIVIAVGVLVILLIVYSSMFVVKQTEGVIIERFGRFHRVLRPGLNFIVPLMDAPRAFTWRKTFVDVNKRVRDETVTQTRVDLRESLFTFQRYEIFSKDTVQLEVSCFMLYRVVDLRRSVYEVDDLAQAVSDTAQSQLKRIFGGLTFAEALASQEIINQQMRAGVSVTYEKWGIHVERIELQDLRPKATSGTANAMKKQMIAERSRRSEFIQAEGNKAAMRLKSEGIKIVKANLGVAEQEATRKRSEGDANAKVEMARAEKVSLETIAEAIEADGCSQTEFMISKRYNELLRGAPATVERKTVFVPYEVSAISGLIATLPSVYGRGRRPGGGGAAPSPLRPAGRDATATGASYTLTAGGGAAAGRAVAAGGGDAYPDLN